jgi:YegS/Rv2252/BmrU family lipid kinase
MTAERRLVVVNPQSASGATARRWRAICNLLEQPGVDVVCALTERIGHATELVREFIDEGGRDIVVLGGDGSVNEVVDGCLDDSRARVRASGIELSVIHQGTGGDFARGLSIPRDVNEAVAVVHGSSTRAIDIGVAEFTDAAGVLARRGWASCCNVGLGAEVVAKVVGRLKRLGDTAGFAVATVGELARNRPRPVTLSFGDEAVAANIVDVMIANNRFVGGGMMVAPDAQFDDGLFDVVVVRAAGRLKLLRTFPKIYKGTHVHDPLVTVRRTPSVAIGTAPGQAQGVVLDGELVGTTPARFDIIPAALHVRVPASAGSTQ